jgi:hypothetical protein
MTRDVNDAHVAFDDVAGDVAGGLTNDAFFEGRLFTVETAPGVVGWADCRGAVVTVVESNSVGGANLLPSDISTGNFGARELTIGRRDDGTWVAFDEETGYFQEVNYRVDTPIMVGDSDSMDRQIEAFDPVMNEFLRQLQQDDPTVIDNPVIDDGSVVKFGDGSIVLHSMQTGNFGGALLKVTLREDGMWIAFDSETGFYEELGFDWPGAANYFIDHSRQETWQEQQDAIEFRKRPLGEDKWNSDVQDGEVTIHSMQTGKFGGARMESLGGNDTLYGHAGNDVMYGGLGSDTMLGGNGIDVLWGGTDGPDTAAPNGVDIVMGGAGDDVILPGGDSLGYLYGETGNDTMYGGSDNDIFFGGTGTDTVHMAQGGNDIVVVNFADMVPSGLEIVHGFGAGDTLVLNAAAQASFVSVNHAGGAYARVLLSGGGQWEIWFSGITAAQLTAQTAYWAG